MKTVVAILESEGFGLERFIWAHAEYGGTIDDYKEMAGRGAFVSLDAVTVGGVPGDDATLDLVQQMMDAGFLDKLLLSTDSTIFVKPPSSQYGYQKHVPLPRVQAQARGPVRSRRDEAAPAGQRHQGLPEGGQRQRLVHRAGSPVMLGRAKTERGKDAGSVHSRSPMGATEDAASRRFAAERARVTSAPWH